VPCSQVVASEATNVREGGQCDIIAQCLHSKRVMVHAYDRSIFVFTPECALTKESELNHLNSSDFGTLADRRMIHLQMTCPT